MSNRSEEHDQFVKDFSFGSQNYNYVCLKEIEHQLSRENNTLPVVIKILLENVARNNSGENEHLLQKLLNWKAHAGTSTVPYQPARVLMQDFTGVPAIVDLAAMRDAIVERGGNAKKINPRCDVDLVIDHSISVESYGQKSALDENIHVEMQKNRERYQFLKWGQKAFENFRVVPPGNGICHQVNLEYLAKVVMAAKKESGVSLAYPDTLVGTDSHTTMINALGVLGWGVGGIEAEAAMLGQSLDLVIPEVVGVCLTGKLTVPATATDLVLTLTDLLRDHGVVGKFVEFYGEGVASLTLSERATISNMSPEFGSTCAFFPVDQETLSYLRITGRSNEQVDLIAKYCMTQGLWHNKQMSPSVYSSHLKVDLATISPCVAGPRRPQDKVLIGALGLASEKAILAQGSGGDSRSPVTIQGEGYQLSHGDVVIAAITSCTNTSNPSVLITAALLAKKANELGLSICPWVKASFAPGSKVVVSYLQQLGLMEHLENLGFFLVGFGCTTCIGNSGPLRSEISQAIRDNGLSVSAVLSGNRNFEGRIHPEVSMNWLASPPLVIAYAIAGTTKINLDRDPLFIDPGGKKVFLKDLWPDASLVSDLQAKISSALFTHAYKDLFVGSSEWEQLQVPDSETYCWQSGSTYIQKPNFFNQHKETQGQDIKDARILVLLGNSITTDHISPAGFIPATSAAGRYLTSKQVHRRDFNSYGSRRGNHHVMVRGTFANIKLKNQCVDNLLGGYTTHWPSGEIVSIYEASERYQESKTPLVVFAGAEYGTGSSRDWAAKGTMMLGVKAVIAESFERIHRSNLIGMGILPCQLIEQKLEALALTGEEKIDIVNINELEKNDGRCLLVITNKLGDRKEIALQARLDTAQEYLYYKRQGVLPYVLEEMMYAE